MVPTRDAIARIPIAQIGPFLIKGRARHLAQRLEAISTNARARQARAPFQIHPEVEARMLASSSPATAGEGARRADEGP